jgi:hypothetical protein
VQPSLADQAKIEQPAELLERCPSDAGVDNGSTGVHNVSVNLTFGACPPGPSIWLSVLKFEGFQVLRQEKGLRHAL